MKSYAEDNIVAEWIFLRYIVGRAAAECGMRGGGRERETEREREREREAVRRGARVGRRTERVAE